jgi:hypothetical protein
MMSKSGHKQPEYGRKQWVSGLPDLLGAAKRTLERVCMGAKRIDDEDVNQACKSLGDAIQKIEDACFLVDVRLP